MTPSLSSPQPVGQRIAFTATASTTGAGPLTYRFEVGRAGSTPFTVRRDFSLANVFDFTASEVEGTYLIRVTARDKNAGETAQATVQFVVTSRVTAGAVVSATAHPLVALFSAPSCPSGSSMRVWFSKVGSTTKDYTSAKTCREGSMNFYVAGMTADSDYEMNFEVITGAGAQDGPAAISFRTGTIPSDLIFPAFSQPVPPGSLADMTTRIQLTNHNVIPPQFRPVIPAAYDFTNGDLVWYYPAKREDWTLLTRPLAGGNMLAIVNGLGTGTGPWPGTGVIQLQQVMREFDLAGNTVRETNADRISEQLAPLGIEPLGRFNHEVIRLPSGNLLVLADNQKMYPAGTQGYAEPVAIIGMVMVLLDKNLQVIWSWDSFNHLGENELDINRRAIRGEVCSSTGGSTGQVGCPPFVMAPIAPDWLHGNSVQYLPDGNLLLSLRNQDWIIKINFGNGLGDGRVLWRMGYQGDFQIVATDPYPWFSGQHEVAFEDFAMTRLTVFDNGNTRVLLQGVGNSRGQVFAVDEANRVVRLGLNADLGSFAAAVGGAQSLSNGNYVFHVGWATPASPVHRAVEVTPNSEFASINEGGGPSYRSWRMRDLYSPPSR
jgi:hypothetical protein